MTPLKLSTLMQQNPDFFFFFAGTRLNFRFFDFANIFSLYLGQTLIYNWFMLLNLEGAAPPATVGLHQ